jgi:tripartite motif-containing protein 71
MGALALAAPARASDGTWDRTWGLGVNGGAGFEVCTIASSCVGGGVGGLGGELEQPVSVATDAAGNVYVADQSNNRIQKYNHLGVWERAWGLGVNGGAGFEVCTVAASCLSGSAGALGGELDGPASVATDAAGNVYVADAANDRIQRYSSLGVWERAWGKNVNGGGVFEVCTMAANCMTGTPGGLGGELAAPLGVATDAAGNVYVADWANQRIQKYNSAGTWERAWGKNVNGGGVFGVCTVAMNCLAGSTGGLSGEFSAPTGVAADPAGNVYVADQSNHRIQKFTSAGTWERAWGKNVNGGGVFGVCTVAMSCLAGTTGGLGGELSVPTGVAADAAGNVYVADQGNQRIQKFTSAGTWERAWGKGVNGGGVFGVCTAASNCMAGTNGGLGGEFNGPTGVAPDSGSALYVGDFTNRRIQKFVDSPSPPPGGGGGSVTPTPPAGPTGQRAAALKKCKKKKRRARRNCIKRAKKLPV